MVSTLEEVILCEIIGKQNIRAKINPFLLENEILYPCFARNLKLDRSFDNLTSIYFKNGASFKLTQLNDY